MTDKDKLITKLKAENEKIKEQIIRLSEENCNLIIRANTSYNNYRDTQRRLDKCISTNIHNLALLSKANKTLQEIKEIAENSCCMTDKDFCSSNSCTVCKSVSDADVIKQILQFITKAEEE